MPGRSNSSNKFGFSSFIVGPTLGDGCNYTSVQQAIDDVFAAGGGVVLIRPGTYTENLILRSGVDLYGAQIDGRPPVFLAQVDIVGNMTASVTAGFNFVLIQDISFSCVAGDLLTINAVTGGTILVAMKFCGVDASTDPASRCVVLNADGASSAQFNTDNTNMQAASHVFETTDVGSCAATLSLGSINSSSGSVFQHSTGSGSLVGNVCQLSAGTYVFNGVAVNGSCRFQNSELTSNEETILFPAGNGQAVLRHCTVNSVAVSGSFIDGTGGQIEYTDIALTGSATAISGAVSQIFADWKPYGSTSNVGVNRYDPTQFIVSASTGEVSIAAPFVPFDWVDQPGLATVVANQGNFNTSVGANSLTLPVAPVQGDVCKFKCTNAQLLTINASGAQTIQMAAVTSIPGGNATSTLIGDAVDLTYFAAGNSWIANSIIGNWNII